MHFLVGLRFSPKRIQCRKLWYRSELWFKHDIVPCIHALICPQRSNASSFFAIILSTEIMMFQKNNLPECWEQYIFSDTAPISSSTEISTLTWHYKHWRWFLLKTHFVWNMLIPEWFGGVQTNHHCFEHYREMNLMTESGLLASYSFWHSQKYFVQVR